MAQFKRTVDVPYSAEKMYDLVDAIEYYPEFLPWCKSARVLTRSPEVVKAALGFRQVGFSGEFTTRNRLSPKSKIDLKLMAGPFDQLAGSWDFDEMMHGSSVTLRMNYRFANPMTGFMFATMVETVAGELITAFADRAEDVYGRQA